VFWAGSHTGVYAAQHTSVHFCGLAVGGSVIGTPTDGNALTNPTRLQKVYDCNAKVVTVLVGANDLVSWNPAWTTDAWLERLWGYIGTLKAKGYKVAVGTILPQYQPTNSVANYTADFNARRKVVNSAIKAAVGTKIDAVIDFAADPVMGPDAAAQNKDLYYDGIHPTDSCGVGCGGQGKMYAIYAPVVDKLLSQ
jgi:lysophospholipase L1-like esterase